MKLVRTPAPGSASVVLLHVWALALFASCATGTPPASASSAAGSPPSAAASALADRDPPTAAGRASSAEAAIGQFFRTLAAGDATQACAVFDQTMKQALAPEQLAQVWAAQTSGFGKLVSVQVGPSVEKSGLDVWAVQLGFEQGALESTVALHPDTGQFAGLFFRPARAAQSPAPYADPSAFHAEEVTVGREPFVLSGTLDLPRGSGPFPAVVLVHGSGPQDRDETIAAQRPFKDIAEGLASRGVLVLRYDKRTFQYGARVGKDIGIDDEVVVDASYALAALRARPELDAQRLFVLGHSLGALLAPEIALRAPPVAGVALLAPPARAPWDAVVDQLRFVGAPAEQLAAVEQAAAGLRDGTLKEGTLLGAPVAYWRDLAARDGIAMARKLNRAVLILHGDRDYQVTDADISLWRKGLEGRKDVQIETFAGDNHLFSQGSGKPGPAEYATPAHVDEAVIRRLASFFTAPQAR